MEGAGGAGADAAHEREQGLARLKLPALEEMIQKESNECLFFAYKKIHNFITERVAKGG